MANSFTTLEFADDYLLLNPENEVWNYQLTEEAKEFLLIRATEILDHMVDWFGTRKSKDSGTGFPREDLPEIDGVEPPDNAVPTPVQRATALLAATLYSEDPFEPAETAGFRSIEVDVVRLELNTKHRTSVIPAFVRLLLSNYGNVPSAQNPRFGRVMR